MQSEFEAVEAMEAVTVKVIQLFPAKRALRTSVDANSNSESASCSEPDVSTGTKLQCIEERDSY